MSSLLERIEAARNEPRQWMAKPRDSWLDERISRREAIEIALFWIGCVVIPVVVFLAR